MKTKLYKSVVQWPQGTLGVDNDISIDEHFTWSEAQAVCNMLLEEGNALGKPLSAHVEKIQG